VWGGSPNCSYTAIFRVSSADLAPYPGAVCVNSLVQCGHRVALIGIVIAHAGQSFDTAGAFGAGRFIWLTAFTTRKMQKATVTKLIRKVMKLP
jgi:hypothetical protein